MKSTRKESNIPKVQPYPKLMVSNSNTVALFEQAGVGTCVNEGASTSSWKVGEQYVDISMCRWRDYNFPVELAND